ncbi:uncharacterized protein LOC106737889 [Alligator mississippiensis]|uniref:uncharacterized protein LOC106737889 n=1 Tax=Alligator mississippiensis TaxID=8496 RepID=UPI000906FD20|nr:uncharacterized protein LOC106737889 [Alligator mississippiensis]
MYCTQQAQSPAGQEEREPAMGRTQLLYFGLLLTCLTVVMFSGQATNHSSPENDTMQAETLHESEHTVFSRSNETATTTDKRVHRTTPQTARTSWDTAVTTVTSVSTLRPSSHFAQSFPYPTNADITGLSETTARYSSVTALSSTLVPFKNFTKHTTSGESNPITSATALKPEAPHPTADSQNVSEALDSVPTTQVSTEGFHLKNSEDILSIGFSSTFVFAVLVIIMHSFLKYRKRKAQYSHRPLHDISSETGDIYTTPDDTLVISGGLYDAPRIYNPNVTALDNDEVQADYLPFGSRSGQFKLEFSLDEKDLSYNFETFQSLPQDSQCSDIVPNTQHTFSDYNLNPLIAL